MRERHWPRDVAVWGGVLALVALGLACALSARAWQSPFPGFFTYRSGAVTSLTRASWAGRAAGLRVRDVVVAVDGEPVEGGASIERALEARRDRSSVTLQVRGPAHWLWPGPHGPPRRVAVPLGHLDAWDVGYTLYLPFSIGIIYLLLGIVLYAVKPRRETALAAALCLLASAFYLTMFDAHTTYRFTRVWLLYPLLGPLSIHLFALFPERRPAWARRRVLGPLYLLGAAVVLWRQVVIDEPGASDTAALASSILLSLEFTVDLGLLARAMLFGGSPAVRNRAKSIFIGLGLTCGASVAWQFASRISPPSTPMTADQAMVLSALFPVLITYALLKRDLFDIDAVLRASVSYFVTTAFVLGVYSVAVAIAGALAARWAGHSTAAAVASTLVAAILFHPVRVRAQRLVDRLWFRERALAPFMRQLSEALALGTPDGVPALAEATLPVLRRLSSARGAALLARLPDRPGFELAGRDGELPGAEAGLPSEGALARVLGERASPLAPGDLPDDAATECAPFRAELLVPLVWKGELSGLVALASRTGAPFSAGVVHALRSAAPQLALALANALLVAEGLRRERLAALGQLAAVIVHEVKNPLGIIKVSAGTLRKRAADDASAELAACVEDEVDRMDATVRRLLELARPPEPRLQPCDVGAVLRQTVDRLRPELSTAGVLLELDLAEARPVAADAEELRRAFLNLFLNARQAMPTGGRLSVRLRARAGGGVDVDVEDTGHGMDEATRRQLFRPFFTTRHGGTGLGLAIVKRVVEDHRGAIRVESRVGEGSRFTVSLPA